MTEFPDAGVWNRLEGRPRTADFGRALRAEVRDPLWMLSRQWQLGEFRGTDGGSPVTVTYSVTPSRPTRFRSFDGAPEDLIPTDSPLETVVERRQLRFTYGTEKIGFDLRLAIGHRWFKLLGQVGLLGQLSDYREQYTTKYPIKPPTAADVTQRANPTVWATMQAVAGRSMDGYELYLHVKGGGAAAAGITTLLGLDLDRNKLNSAGTRLVSWFDALIDQPTGVTPDRPEGNTAWDPRRLEHRFSVAATMPGGAEKTLTSQEYPGGELDWHAFSIETGNPLGGAKPPESTISRTVFPAPVRYSGMPLPRWWALEDGKTNFAAVHPDSTDLARLVFLEFALVFSNDWYQVPCDLPAGTVARIRGLAVTDVFGIRQWVKPAGQGFDEDWQRWSMYTLDTIGVDDVPADTDMVLPPSVPKVAVGPPLEEVLMIRDENANLVWGIEQTVRLPTGDPHRGSEAAAEMLAYRRRQAGTPVVTDPPRAALSYAALNTIPEHWIPFIPVHVDRDNREIQLQRAAMPSALDVEPVPPRTTLLREGFDRDEWYFVNEEEVPQAGTRLSVAYNRTRWADGRAVVWLSAQRGEGRGQGSSGLVFDLLVNTPIVPG
ncbi:hypothetical protein [Actinophytocola sp.]|uniref:hypothetical protein n=1 Tax=Actinophytocola sp. TaxID=1872138 RepID=UPI00389B3193